MALNTPAQALAFAQSHKTWPMDMCDYFVAACYGLTASGYNTALDHWNASTQRHPGDTNAPAGALQFWGGGQGHVALSAGGGLIWSTDISGNGTVSLVAATQIATKWGKPYLGWTVPQFQNQFAVLTQPPGGTVSLSSADVMSIWAYHGGDATGPADTPDVHQSLLTTRDNSATLLAAVKTLTSQIAALKLELDAIKLKVGA